MFIKNVFTLLVTLVIISFSSFYFTQDYVDVSLKEIDMNSQELSCPPGNGFVNDLVLSTASGASGVGIGWGANLYLQSEIGAANTIFDLTWIIGTSTNYSGTKYTFDNTDIWMYEYTGSQFPSTTRPDVQTWSTGTLPAGVSNLVKVMSNGKIVLTDVGSECISSTENSLDIPYVYSGTKSLVIYIEKKTKATNSTGSTWAWPAFKHNTRQSGIRRVCNWEGTLAVPLNSNSLLSSSSAKKFARIVFNRVKANRNVNKSCSTTKFLGNCVISTCVIKSITPSATSVCKGGTDITFTKDPTTVAGTFSSTSGLVIDATTGKINIAFSTPGTYTVTFTESADASCRTQSKITINNLQNNSTSLASSNSNLCINTSLTPITHTTTGATGIGPATKLPLGVTAQWSGNMITISGTPTQSGIFDYEIPLTGGCGTINATGKIIVNPTPYVPTISSTAATCSSAEVNTITNYDGSLTYTFTPAGPTVGALGVITGMTVSTNYTVTAGNGTCTSSSSVAFNNDPQLTPPAVPTISSTAATCSSAEVSTITNYDGALTYTFTPAGPTVGAGGVISGMTASTNYIVTSGNGMCTSSSSTTFNNDPQLNSNLSPITGIKDICQGTTSQLANTTPGGTWSSSNPSVAIINSSGLVTALSAGTSTINYTVPGSGSCSQSASTTIQVNEKPIVNSIPDQQVCEGTSFNPINFSGTSGATFNWTNSDVKIGLDASGSGNINAFIAKGTIPGGAAFTSYISVTPKIGSCIGNMYILKLSVSPTDNASFSYNNDYFCKNQTDPIPVILGTKGGSFTAITTGLVLDNVTGSIKLSASSPGNHTVIYKTAGKCNTNQTVSFVIQSTPTIDSIPDYTICPGMFNDSIKIKGTVGASFEWTNSNTKTGLSAKGQNIIYPFNAINNGTTNVISEISIIPTLGGCVGTTKKFNIVVRTTPNLSIYQVDSLVCAGGTLNFKTVLTPTTATPVYQWYVNDAKVGANSAFYWSKTLKNKDKISVSVTSKDFCPKMVSTYARVDSLRLSMNVPTMVYLKAPVVNLVGYPSGGVFSGKGITNNKLDPSILGVGNKTVTYSFQNSNNCSGEITQKVVIFDTITNICHVTKYDTVKVNVTDTVSILKVKFKLTTGIKANQETSMRVYPNPTSDILLIEVADEKAMAGYRYKILDAAGKEVYNQPVKSAITEISLKSLGAAGTYFFEVYDEKFQRVVSKKIILD